MIFQKEILQLHQIKTHEHTWVAMELGFRQVARINDVDFPRLVKCKVIAKCNLFVVKQLHHFLLCKGGEEQSELNFVVSVNSVEEGFEIPVSHFMGLDCGAYLVQQLGL